MINELCLAIRERLEEALKLIFGYYFMVCVLKIAIQ